MAEHQGTYPVVVAVDDAGTVLGFGSLSSYRDRPSYSTTVENSVYVDAGRRGEGVGRALLEELVRLGTLARVPLHDRPGRRGQRAPRSPSTRPAGSSWSGVEREIGRKFNRWLDVAVLQRMLGGDGFDARRRPEPSGGPARPGRAGRRLRRRHGGRRAARPSATGGAGPRTDSGTVMHDQDPQQRQHDQQRVAVEQGRDQLGAARAAR